MGCISALEKVEGHTGEGIELGMMKNTWKIAFDLGKDKSLYRKPHLILERMKKIYGSTLG